MFFLNQGRVMVKVKGSRADLVRPAVQMDRILWPELWEKSGLALPLPEEIPEPTQVYPVDAVTLYMSGIRQ